MRINAYVRTAPVAALFCYTHKEANTFMITRDMIYSHEAADLLRTLSLYKTLLEKQVYRMFPDKKQQAIHTLVERYIKDGRIFRDQRRQLLSALPEPELDVGMIKAFWVLLDFIDETEYHSAGDFPIRLYFFAQAEMYEVVYVQPGQEALISQALMNKADDEGKKIMVVESLKQISDISCSNVSGYCLVDEQGTTHYFKEKDLCENG